MASQEHPEPRRSHPLRTDAAILLVVGFLLFAAGIALVVAPQYSQRARSVAGALERFAGIQSGVLLLGGLVFFSLGILARGVTRVNASIRIPSSRPAPEETADASPAVEELAQEMGELRSTIQQVAANVAETSDTLQRLLQTQETLGRLQGEARDPDPERPSPGHDPLFRLASSLDQMNAQLDERLSALTAHVDERLASLHDLLEAEGEDPDGYPSASETDGAEPLEVLIQLEDDPEATRPSPFFEGVGGLDAAQDQASAGGPPAPPGRP